MDVTFSFGAWINQRRRMLRLTQQEVANLIGCSVALIRKLESDQRRPSTQIAERLARALHIRSDDTPAFVRAARAELASDQLPAPAAVATQTIRDAGQRYAPPYPAFPAPAVTYAQGNIPQQVSSFHGREREISELHMLLRQDGVRLVTLTGPGGIGKTRLALEIAAGLRDAYPDGIWFVDLAPVQDPQQVMGVIAQTCGLPEQSDSSTQILMRWLRTKRLLLIIDNYEHVIESALLVTEILRTAAQVQILITSRMCLRLMGEHEYQVRSLSLSETAFAATTLLHFSDAVQLFADRARCVQPSLQLNSATAPIIHEICLRLEGLPLAIELAAARIRVFSPEQLLERLQSATLALLDAGKRDLPARQQTMRATIAWSYQLLHPDQRRLLARLSVFVGGWTLEASEVVGAEDGLVVIDALEDLVEQSLVQRISVDGWPRFTMLEVIREYAREQLADPVAVQRCHALYMLEYAERHVKQIEQSAQFLASRLLFCDHENLRAALEWLFVSDRQRAFQLTCTLWEYWNMHGRLVEAAHWLTNVLEQSSDAPPLLRAYALDRLGWTVHLFDQNERAIALFQESAALYHSQHDTLGATVSMMHLCLAYRKQSRFELAYQVLDHCLPIFRAAQATQGVAWCLFLRGVLLMDQNQLDAAWLLLHEARICFQQCHDQFFPDWICYNLGHIARLRGDLDLAELKSLYEVGNRRRIADVLDGLGGVFISRR